MDERKIKEIEEKIANLEGRWPSHSVPPSMWRELEELEEQLEKAREDAPANAAEETPGGQTDGGGPADGR